MTKSAQHSADRIQSVVWQRQEKRRASSQPAKTPKSLWQLLIPETGVDLICRLESAGRRLTDTEFEEFCALNPEMRIEMTKEGKVMIMMPVTSQGSSRNFLLTVRFGVWVETDGTGIGFDSSGGFTLPNGAKRSPDISWMRRERWDALTQKQKDEFTRLCPDFVVELRSKSDRLKPLQKKMIEYLENGAQLGWLIDPLEKKIHVYRPGQPVETLDRPTQISGEPLLKDFMLILKGIVD